MERRASRSSKGHKLADSRESFVSRNKTLAMVGLVAPLLAGCGGGDDQPATEQAAQTTQAVQTAADPGTTAKAVVEDLRADGFKVTGVTEGESFPARETLNCGSTV